MRTQDCDSGLPLLKRSESIQFGQCVLNFWGFFLKLNKHVDNYCRLKGESEVFSETPQTEQSFFSLDNFHRKVVSTDVSA